MSLSLKIKTTNGRIIETFADPDLTIYDLKAICCEELQTSPENQTLLFKGKVCDNDDTLDSIKITDNSTLIVLLKKNNKKQSPNQPQPPQQQQQEEEKKEEKQNDNNNNNNNMMMMNNMMMNGMNGMNGMNMSSFQSMQQSMQQSLMQNPNLLKQMMNNPMMQQMFNNPEILQNLFNSSPALQQLLRDNPQLRHALKDPSLMQHAMRAASNPEYYNEMLKNNDRALRNIESIPGGFSALSRLYNQIQKPMERAMDDMYRQRFGKSKTKISTIDKSNGPINTPMENPWSTQQPQPQQPQQPQSQQQQQPPFNMSNMANIMNMMNMMNSNNNNNNNNNQQQFVMNENPSQIYVIQLRELRNMGFNDEQRNINALIATGGNVAAAVQRLIENNGNNAPNDSNKTNDSNKE